MSTKTLRLRKRRASCEYMPSIDGSRIQLTAHLRSFLPGLYGMNDAPQAQAEGLCLRYPEPLGLHAQISHENAVNMLLRAIQLSQHTPFVWGYIDKPNGTRLRA